MLSYSSFVRKKDFSGIVKETKFAMIYSITLFLTGILFLLIPIQNISGLMMLAASWVLIIAIGLTIIRPFLFCKGIADVSMAFVADMLYFVIEISFGYSVGAIAGMKLLLSFVLFMLGVSRIITFAQILNRANFPVLIVSGISEMAAAAIIFTQWPTGSYGIIYWALGMTIVVSSFESLNEALRLKTRA